MACEIGYTLGNRGGKGQVRHTLGIPFLRQKLDLLFPFEDAVSLSVFKTGEDTNRGFQAHHSCSACGKGELSALSLWGAGDSLNPWSLAEGLGQTRQSPPACTRGPGPSGFARVMSGKPDTLGHAGQGRTGQRDSQLLWQLPVSQSP